ncbi:hypothetical protein RDI58_009787 [Solanum bulbocastanum]|uniref:Uncharacterized protein n=1 Tax=Solanum bulbocastanum TaxID=147425 RepID=A0AAN8YG52_SOLBU
MASSSTSSILSTSHILPTKPFFPQIRRLSTNIIRTMTTLAMIRRDEAHDPNYYNDRNVDENMIALRKRIQDMKMIERKYEPQGESSRREKKRKEEKRGEKRRGSSIRRDYCVL